MITKQHSNYLPFLAQKYTLLVISNRNFEVFDELENFFSALMRLPLDPVGLENLSVTLVNAKIDIVVLDATGDNKEIAEVFLRAIQKYNSRIVVISLVDLENLDSVSTILKQSDHILFEPFTKEELRGKLVQVLSVFYAVISIGRREMNLKSGSSETTVMSNFLDMYEGSILFIVDELIELNQDLKSGLLSKELLSSVGENILQIADIFTKDALFSDVVPIFNDLGYFLKHIDLGAIKPSGLKGFDYLCAILDDLNKNMMDIFVDRIFQDVHLFEDSLKNNIDFMKKHLFSTNEQENDGDLEFF